ncbi:MAG TPA: M28 family peptidase [Vicinamibacterales bacterium]|nr:M28 family peptidase [Vicinamibacterales bacterium]
MIARAILLGPVAAFCVAAVLGQAPADTLPRTAERAYHAVTTRFDERDALSVVSFMDQYWRVAGNPGFNASIDHIRDRLVAAGYRAGSSTAVGRVRVEEFPNTGRGWDYRVGTVEFDGASEPPLLSREHDRVSLAINSFSTPPGGLVAPIVDIGGRRARDYETLKGMVVLGDAPLARLWQEAVKGAGAAGVISTEIASYIRPADPARMSEEQKDVLQWGSIPDDASAKSFGFKSSWRAANRIRERMKRGPVRVRVTVDSSFYDGPNRTLIAEIPGRSHPDERIVLVAHVQEPGANDDASGCATLYALARALLSAIAAGELPAPERTLTFMWVDEVRGSRQWLSHLSDAAGVKYMFALDMTGEDTGKTGGTFLIEKQADPSAVWSRPSDPHTEWGRGDVAERSLKGSLLNDLHLAVCLRRARDTKWTVRTNPYEGGSDHTTFAAAGVPSLLNWHFTDRYYHTNQDRVDKVSAAEMKNVAVAVATSAWLLASADDADATVVLNIIAGAAARRLALERTQGAALVAQAADAAAAGATEQRVRAAWIKWYEEALDSLERLPVGGATDTLRSRIAAAKHAISLQSKH